MSIIEDTLYNLILQARDRKNKVEICGEYDDEPADGENNDSIGYLKRCLQQALRDLEEEEFHKHEYGLNGFCGCGKDGNA